MVSFCGSRCPGDLPFPPVLVHLIHKGERQGDELSEAAKGTGISWLLSSGSLPLKIWSQVLGMSKRRILCCAARRQKLSCGGKVVCSLGSSCCLCFSAELLTQISLCYKLPTGQLAWFGHHHDIKLYQLPEQCGSVQNASWAWALACGSSWTCTWDVMKLGLVVLGHNSSQDGAHHLGLQHCLNYSMGAS